MARSTVRVKIPRNTGELIALAKLIFAKHSTDGPNSPLKAMEDYNWADTAAKLTKAGDLQKQVDDLRKQAEKLQGDIDLLVPDIRGSVTGSRDILLGNFKKNPKRLGDWGYAVDDSPKTKKTETTNG